MRSSGSLAAMLCFVAGETLRSPMMDSSTASQSALFSTAAPASGAAEESLEMETWMIKNHQARRSAIFTVKLSREYNVEITVHKRVNSR